MIEPNPCNERIKRRYFRYLREARGLAPATINNAGLAIASFEQFTSARCFKKFTHEHAVAFKRHLWTRGGKRASELSARATVVSKLRQVQQFFRWLADQDGYRSKIRYSDLEYFNPRGRDATLVRARREKQAPSVQQVCHVIECLPSTTDTERRNKALITLALLTGARVAALSSLKLKHVRSDGLGIDQDAREVQTKFAKTQTTFFFPVGDDLRLGFLGYVQHLQGVLRFGPSDPLFPATLQIVGEDHQFRVDGLTRHHWKTTDPIRTIFRSAFSAAGLPYYSPHTLRNCLTALGQRICRTPEEMKAWSQNLGHDEVLTTLTSYGAIPLQRQAELVSHVSVEEADSADVMAALRAVLRRTATLPDLDGGE